MPLLPSHTLLQTYNLTLLVTSYLFVLSPLTLLNSSALWLLGESMHIPRASFVPPVSNQASNPAAFAPGVTLEAKRSIIDRVLGSSSSALSRDLREALALLGLVLFLAGVAQAVLVTPLRYSKGDLVRSAVKSRGVKREGARFTAGGTEMEASAVSEFAEKVHTLHTAQTLFLTLAALRVVVEGALVAWIYVGYSDRKHRIGLDVSVGGMRGADGVVGLLANRIVFAVAMGDMLFWGYIWTVLREEVRDVAEVIARRRMAEAEEDERN